MAGKLETSKVLEELDVCILSDGAERAAVSHREATSDSQKTHARHPGMYQ